MVPVSFVWTVVAFLFITSFPGLVLFCPELLLDGDDVVVFDLFAKLVDSLGRCGLLSSGEVTESKAEFLSYVVEARQRHVSGGTISSDIKSVVTYLMRQYAFQSRHCLMRVFQLCCLFIESQDVAPALIDFGFSECVIRPGLLTSCLRSVQSFVSSSSYDQSSFFSSTTVDRVRQSLGSADAFMEKAFYSLGRRVHWSHIIKQLTSPIAMFLLLPRLLNSGQHNCQLVRRQLCLPSLLASLKPRRMMEERL